MKPIDDQKIDDFIMNKLIGSELDAFTAQMESDPELASEVKLRQQLLAELDVLSDYKTQQKIQAVHKTEMARFRGKKRRIVAIWRFAAAAIFGLLAFSVWWFTDEATPAELYASNYSPYSYKYGVRDVDTINPALKQASDYYQNQNYEQAIPLLIKGMEENPDETELYLALGISLFETGDAEAALQQFDYLIRKQDRFYAGEALWYSSLIELNRGNIDNTTTFLNQITTSNSNDSLYQKAQNLLKKLG